MKQFLLFKRHRCYFGKYPNFMEQITLALSHLEKLSDTNPICFQSTILLSNEKEKITLMQKSVKYVDNNYTEHTFK